MSEAEEDIRGQIWDRPSHLMLARDLNLGSRSNTIQRRGLDVKDRLEIYADHLNIRG
jgi:hypothetical protein